MTITRLWHAGCESSGASSSIEFDALSGSATISNDWAKTGSYSLRVSSYLAYAKINLPVGIREIRCGFFMKSAGASYNTPFLFSIWSTSSRLCGIKIMAGEARATLEVLGTNRGSTADCFPDGNGHHWGVHVKINAAAGWVKVYRDGVEVLSFVGNTSNADIASVRFGNDSASANLATYTYYDDLYIDDTTGETAPEAPPAYQFLWCLPNGNGSNSGWMGSDGQTDNYALVDEAAQNGDTDYVYADAADLVDSYAMSNVTIPSGYACTAVCPYPIARKTGVGDVKLKAFIRSGGATAEGTAVALATSYAPKVFTRFTTDPATGAAWTQSGLNGMECGIKSAGTFV